MRLALVVLAALAATTARARDIDGRWAQADPGLREWFRGQQVPSGPSKGMSCCSEADGVAAQEAWHGDHYKAAFTIVNPVTKEEIDIPWMDVPPDAVLEGPFPKQLGQPIVWYFVEWDDSRAGVMKQGADGRPIVHIRCFKPSAGV